MAALSYTLYDFVDVPTGTSLVDSKVASSDATLHLTTNGPFEFQSPEIDWSLYVSIDGYQIGRLYSGLEGYDPARGYFAQDDDPLPYGTAIIPRDIWRSIIADGELEVTYDLGIDATERARPENYITIAVDWLDTYGSLHGTPAGETLTATVPSLIMGMSGNDTITGSDQGDFVQGGMGNDTIDGGAGPDWLRGEDGNDSVAGGFGNDMILGGYGVDTLTGGFGDDVIGGEAGDDVIDETLFGDGNDRLRGDDGNDIIRGGYGVDRLWGGRDNDSLEGGESDDYLWGGSGDDELTGGHGTNHLFGGAGADSFIFAAPRGIEGQHVYDFDRRAGDTLVYVQDFDEVVDSFDIRDGKDGSVITIGDLGIVVSGAHDLTAADLTFRSDGRGLNAGALAVAEEPYVQYTGSPFDDFMMTNHRAIMLGLGGNDTIIGTEWGDIIQGGTGNDTIDGGAGDNFIRGNADDDTADGGEGHDYVSGGTGNDQLAGGGGDDNVFGDAGDDTLSGGDGSDKLRGGTGLDDLTGGTGDDLLWGGEQRDWLYGNEGTDWLRGEAGNDDLAGDAGNDYLWGGDGDDMLIGGAGNNHLFGGSGADEFVFATAHAGTHHVYDFNRAEGDALIYVRDFDDVVDGYDIRVGKDGSVVTIGDVSIIVSGAFDLTAADITLRADTDTLV